MNEYEIICKGTIIITLSARQLKPDAGRRLTRLLNWALLPALPGGTVVGLYGLLRADKSGTGASSV